jgi:hypothetical protein
MWLAAPGCGALGPCYIGRWRRGGQCPPGCGASMDSRNLLGRWRRGGQCCYFLCIYKYNTNKLAPSLPFIPPHSISSFTSPPFNLFYFGYGASPCLFHFILVVGLQWIQGPYYIGGWKRENTIQTNLLHLSPSHHPINKVTTRASLSTETSTTTESTTMLNPKIFTPTESNPES